MRSVVLILFLASFALACDNTSRSRTWTTLLDVGPNSPSGPTGLDLSNPIPAGTYYLYGSASGCTNCDCAQVGCSSCSGCCRRDRNLFELSTGPLNGVANQPSGPFFDDSTPLKDHSGISVTLTVGTYNAATAAQAQNGVIGSFGPTLTFTVAPPGTVEWESPLPSSTWYMYTPGCARFHYEGSEATADVLVVHLSTGDTITVAENVPLSSGGYYVPLDVSCSKIRPGDVCVRLVGDGGGTYDSPAFNLGTTPVGSWSSQTCGDNLASPTPTPSTTSTPSVSASRTPSISVTPSITPSRTPSPLPCDPLDVQFNGRCYYLDGNNGACLPGYTLAPQSILNSIANMFIGKNYRTAVSNNCCIKHSQQAAEGQDWGFSCSTGQCNGAGPFFEAPSLGGCGCNNSNNNNSRQLSICQSV